MTGQIHMRIDQKLLTDFKKQCQKMNRQHHDVIKEMITAVVQGRLRIQPTPQQKELYQDD